MNPQKRILIVDDDPNICLVLKDSLQRMPAGYQIETAPDGRTALSMLKDDDFDLLISDLRMPGLDGIKLVELLRAMPLKLIIIWITAYHSKELEADRKRLSVTSLLHKPLRINQIRQAVQIALAAP